ncbi:MAG: MscL family protein [Candidatus Shapirobacteria bacterium]|nr:MscL family protein [Candidatus Shapirobacteria bacterium]MDD4410819.1 MscL family protein [Candidatus Shapirobacteria bacterium]
MKSIKGFIEFIRSQGVVGLAVGFIMGGSITKFITSFVTDIINPLVGILISRAGDLKSNYIPIGSAKIMWGNFVSSFIDFIIIALVVYFGVKVLKLDKLDKKK